MDDLKILVVDDESRMRKLVKDFLNKDGYIVVEAENGQQALDIFYQDKDIALIILDVMMPIRDGWEVCREIRENSKVHIIMLTAKAEELGKEVGCEVANGWYLYGFFQGAGCTLTENEDQSNNCDWNSETGLAAAESLQSIASSSAFKSYGNDDLLANLNDGKVIAYVSGTWNVNAFSEAYGDGYAATKLPTFQVNGEDKQMASYSGYKFVGVNAYAENTGWSMLLAEFLTNAETQEAVYAATGEGPSNTEALSAASSVALEALAAQSEFAELQRVGGNYWTPAESLGKNILDGKVSQQVLDDAVAGITQAVE